MRPVRRIALLDVNVLFALFDPDHVHHEIAHDWFENHHASGWATCPLTENGFVRTASALARTRRQVSVATLVAGLRTFTSSGHHQFWSDDLSLLNDERLDAERILGHQQVTDVYLLALAVRHRGVLATFDRKIPIDAVRDATPEHVVVLAPAEARSREPRA